MLTATAVVPCYNCARYIAEVVAAVKAQTCSFAEILVIDDGSTDQSARIAESCGARVVRQNRNCGLAAARNKGITLATTNFVACIDSDVIVKPDWLELLGLDLNRGAAMAGGMLIERFHRLPPDRWRELHMPQDNGQLPIRFDDSAPGRLSGFGLLFDRATILDIGGFNERFGRSFEDVDLSNRLIAHGYSLSYNPRAVAEHVRQDNILSVLRSSWSWDHWPELESGSYDSLFRLVKKCLKNLHWTIELSVQHMKIGEVELIPVDLALLGCFTNWDVRYYLYRNVPLFRKSLQGADLGNYKEHGSFRVEPSKDSSNNLPTRTH